MNEETKELLIALPLLTLSAMLEAGGDAAMRAGLHGKRLGFLFGGLLLMAYGVVVNLPRWNFSRLMGVYIAVFFLVSQIIAVGWFREKINAPLVVGGALIVAGGLVLTFWRVS